MAQTNKSIEKTKKKQYSRGLGDGGDWHKAKKNIEKTKKKQKKNKNNKKNNIPEVLGMGRSHQEFPNIVFLCLFCFFWFSQCFLISLHGVLPKETQSIFFYVIITWRFILFFFSVYGTKWWTDNLKSRQVERVLTKFKGCEPSCRKVQTVAALVGSGGGGDHTYIYIYNVYIHT